MILKATQRGGAKQLGLHLLKVDDNEHIELHEIRGFVSDDVVGALKEAYAVSRGTKCKQFLFSVSLNPPQREKVGVDVFKQTIDRIEKINGLTGHPRVVIFHEKEGRRHAHAVWSRIDATSMTAVNLPFFKFKLRDLSRELYLENDWKMPRGLAKQAPADPRNYSLAEYQQAKRLGLKTPDLKSIVQDCWAISDSHAAFEHALSECGMILAKGDRRGHVAVTHTGDVLSIARYASKRAKEVRAKLGEPEGLPNVTEARSHMRRDMAAAFKRHAEEARSAKNAVLYDLQYQLEQLTAKHRDERQCLDESQRVRWKAETQARAACFKSGLSGLWQRVTGQRQRIVKQNDRDTLAALSRDQEQRDDLVHVQLRERQAFQRMTQNVRHHFAQVLGDVRKERHLFNERARGQDMEPGKSRRRRGHDPTQDMD